MALTSSPGAAGWTAARDNVADEGAARLGPWRLLKTVSAGEFATVYQAVPAEGGPRAHSYAIKVLNGEQELDSPAAERFLREAAVGRSVAHRHLVSVLSAQVQSSPYYLVMPWLEGATLAEHLQRAPLPTYFALWIVRQVAEALDALTQAGWMHGDVKPANIQVSPQGHATLLDLGFARQTDESMTAINRPIMGTLHHIAPELLTSTLRGDARSDIYSLGATLYECLTGRTLFNANSLAELATQHRTHHPLPVRDIVPEVSADVAQLVHRMLAKEPLRRPQHPRELLDELIPLEIRALAQRRTRKAP